MDSMVGAIKKTLVIRADANTRMGTGHIMRCMALGQAWLDADRHQAEVRDQKSDVSLSSVDGLPSSVLRPPAAAKVLAGKPSSVTFICADIPDVLAERVTSEGFDLIRINADLGSSEDLQQTLEATRSIIGNRQSAMTCQWLVTDGYHFNFDYQRGIRAAGIKLLLIDDYNHQPEYEADILLNQNIGAEEIEYHCNTDCRKLLGTRYIMLRREFRNAKPRERSGAPKNILVTMGGADPDNVTLKVVKALGQLDIPDLQVKVVVGSANPHMESLKLFASSATINCQLSNSVRDMPGLMHWADFAISAAGSTCWELAVMGVPFITVILAENQEQVAQVLEKTKGIPCAGWADDGLSSRVADQLKDCWLKELAASPCSDWVDRFGVDRILCKSAADSGLDYYKNRLVLRDASMDDAQLLFGWANDPVTRQNSFNPEPILWNSHVEWMQNKLTDSNARLFVLELEEVACGHIRYQIEKSGEALLSFVVDPQFRSMGIGDALVAKSRYVICKQWPTCRIKALTLLENRASAAIFRKNGFLEEHGTADGKRCLFFYWSCVNHEE
jgi:UDP-2,4-diacetamido-2,4,6-trideoxy-beta-L-altropyranose hydrolase